MPLESFSASKFAAALNGSVDLDVLSFLAEGSNEA